MIDPLALGLTLLSALGGLAVLAAAAAGRYRWTRTWPLLVWLQLATTAQVGLALAGLALGHRPTSLPTHLAYLVVALLALPTVAAQARGDDGRWAGVLVAVGLFVLAVVIVRAQTTWRSAGG